jgi:hypothetical protein
MHFPLFIEMIPCNLYQGVFQMQDLLDRLLECQEQINRLLVRL